MGWWAASHGEQSESQLGALDDVRATPANSTLVSNAGLTALWTQPETKRTQPRTVPAIGGRVPLDFDPKGHLPLWKHAVKSSIVTKRNSIAFRTDEARLVDFAFVCVFVFTARAVPAV